jgi:hypothetical protein
MHSSRQVPSWLIFDVRQPNPSKDFTCEARPLSLVLLPMPAVLSSEIELLRAAYAAFNARDIDAAVATMTADVAWPKAFKGGFARGPEEIRAYWTEQWSEIDPHVEPTAFHREDAQRIVVDVHQVVRDLNGAVLADSHVGHRFTLTKGLIQAMEVCPPPSATPNA